TARFGAYWARSARQIPDKGGLRDYWIWISSAGDFLGTAPHLKRYLRLFAAGRKSMAHISGRQFVARLAEYFGLLTAKILGGLTVIATKLPIIDMGELPLPPPPPAATRTVPQRLGRLEEEVQGLRRDVGSLRGLVKRSMTDQGRFSTWMMSCMTQLMDASGLTYQAFDGSFRGSSLVAFQRRTRQRAGEANTSTALQDLQQPDP
ncbi:hypothetical protein Tco_1527806, partial [Tanacetum coccineum]